MISESKKHGQCDQQPYDHKGALEKNNIFTYSVIHV